MIEVKDQMGVIPYQGMDTCSTEVEKGRKEVTNTSLGDELKQPRVRRFRRLKEDKRTPMRELT